MFKRYNDKYFLAYFKTGHSTQSVILYVRILRSIIKVNLFYRTVPANTYVAEAKKSGICRN